MGYRSGLAAQFGFAQETTWGTYATATRFQEFLSESLQLSIARIESAGLRSQQAWQATDRWVGGRQGVAGDISLEVMNKNYGMFFKHMLGAAAITADGSGWKHTFTPGDLGGLSMSMEVGRPQTDSTVKSYQYSGVKINSWTMTNTAEGLLDLTLSVDGKAESTAGGLASASYVATQELFSFTEGTISVGGVSTPVNSWTLTGNNNLKTDRYKIYNAGATKLEQIHASFREMTGSIDVDFADQTTYSNFVNGSLAAVVLTYQTTTTYDTAKPYKMVVTMPNCRFDGTTVNVGGPDVLNASYPFKALDDRTNPVIKIEYYTSDTTP